MSDVPAKLAAALEDLMSRCFHRCLFPNEVRAALDALDAYELSVAKPRRRSSVPAASLSTATVSSGKVGS